MKAPTLRTHTVNHAASSSSSSVGSTPGGILAPLRRRTLRPVFVSSPAPRRLSSRLRLAA